MQQTKLVTKKLFLLFNFDVISHKSTLPLHDNVTFKASVGKASPIWGFLDHMLKEKHLLINGT